MGCFQAIGRHLLNLVYTEAIEKKQASTILLLEEGMLLTAMPVF